MELRKYLFYSLGEQPFLFSITSREKGFFSGATLLGEMAAELGLRTTWQASEGVPLEPGKCVFQATGTASQIARAEEMLLGVIGKPSGVATAAACFAKAADDRIKVVCGAWKKIAPKIRTELRQAIVTGGVGTRITDQPFIYLDKNYVRLLGGVGPAIERARAYDTRRLVVVQLRGETQPIADEAITALESGAAILMVDTGKPEDLATTAGLVAKSSRRKEVQLAFAGGVAAADLEMLIFLGADIVDVGRAIIDAPLLDLSLDVKGPANSL